MLIQDPMLRHQLGYVIIFSDTIRGNKQRLQKVFRYYLFNREIIDQKVFEDCMSVLNNHQALVIDYTRFKNILYLDITASKCTISFTITVKLLGTSGYMIQLATTSTN